MFGVAETLWTWGCLRYLVFKMCRRGAHTRQMMELVELVRVLGQGQGLLMECQLEVGRQALTRTPCGQWEQQNLAVALLVLEPRHQAASHRAPTR